MVPVTDSKSDKIRVHPEWVLLNNTKKIAAVPDGPWVVKLTNPPAATNKFHRAFSRTWFVIGLKDYFIQQDLHI